MSKKVLIQSPIQEEAETFLRRHGFEISRGSGTDKVSLLRDIADCDAIVVKKVNGYRIDKEVIDHAKKLKIIARFGVGIEIIDVDYARQQGIIVTSSPQSNSNAVAEHTMYLMLACAKNAPALRQRLYSGVFNNGAPAFSLELSDVTLGIIGCGRIGSMAARKARHGFDMNVIGYDAYLPPDQFSPDISRRNSMEEVLREADIVSIHLHSTPETYHLISERELAWMKPTAYLINVSRGEILDEAAVYRALASGVIAGAGLDVFETEPLPLDNPLLQLDNVVLTPHYAAFTQGAIQRASQDVSEDIAAVFEKKRPKWEVTDLGVSPRLD